MAAKAKENYEERGIETLFLAWGMAAWDAEGMSSAIPAAPALMAPLSISAAGAAQQDFQLRLAEDFEVNPTLVQFLSSEFAVELDADDLLSRWEQSGADRLDPSPVFEELLKSCGSVPEFSISDSVVIGNFSYAKLPMVKDLETGVEVLIANDLTAAIAGDSDARQRMAEKRYDGSATEPDRLPPQDEYLILDADASQNYAINACLAGESLVIQGPPGTGKSQTISNLIASLVARGKRVLFVAEKRAAIDAVTKRLDSAGLRSLLMDLHGTAKSKKETAAELQATLARIGSQTLPDNLRTHQRLVQRRNELNGHVEALHGHRDPWGISVDQLQVGLMALRPSITDVRLDAETVGMTTESQADALAELIGEYTSNGGFDEPSGSAWNRAAVVSAGDAEQARQLFHEIRGDRLPLVKSSIAAICAQHRFKAPESLGASSDLLEWLSGVNTTLNTFRTEIFDFARSREFRSTIENLEPCERGPIRRVVASTFSGRYRKAARDLRLLALDQAPGLAELRHVAVAATKQQEQWEALGGGAPTLTPQADQATLHLNELTSELNSLARYAPALTGAADLNHLDAALEELGDGLPYLAVYPRLAELESALQYAGFGLLLRRLVETDSNAASAVDSLWYAWMSSVHEQIGTQDTRVGAFNGATHSERVADFRSLDREHILSTAERVARRVAEQAVEAMDRHPEEADLVRAQAGRRRGHLPLRHLFERAPNVLTALKPCWTMSPLLVSQLLPATPDFFDVVIFDEASQVTPADAITALMRAPQAVVAGDDRQLPPTTFFAAGLDDEEDEDDGGASLVTGFQSILDVLNALLRSYTLTWHYRSEDERLIAFSNTYLYDRSLTTFPGVAGAECLQYIPIADPRFDNTGRSSDAEVEAVVSLILEHAHNEPEASLGVITMGITHANRIKDALWTRLATESALDAFFDEKSQEPFFIKNLERVQGDERDVVILSIGYGARNADGRLRYNFGPINQDGGERRLNVAVTRARQRLRLVSTFSHDDMDPGRSSAHGVELMRLYLAYVASRGSDLGNEAGAVPRLNPFERDVRDRLERRGIPLHPQFGASGFRIDFAAAHPDQPGRMVLAMECDGASYHSSDTARDRDRLRQQTLERLGWRFHRIWSTDWFNDPGGQTEEAYRAWQEAVALSDRESANEGNRSETQAIATPAQSTEAARSRRRPNLPTSQPINTYTFSDLVDLAKWIESDTLLRTEDELLSEMMQELGLRRRGRVIVDILSRAIFTAR